MNSLSWRPPTQHSKEQWIHAMFHYKSEQKIKKDYNQSLSNFKASFLKSNPEQSCIEVLDCYWVRQLASPSLLDRDHTIPSGNGKYGEWPRGAQVEWFLTRGQGS